MFVLGNFFTALALVFKAILFLLEIVIIARVIISWVGADPYNIIVMYIRMATDPILRPIQRLIPPVGGLDFSPIIALLTIMFLKVFLVTSLIQLGRQLGSG